MAKTRKSDKEAGDKMVEALVDAVAEATGEPKPERRAKRSVQECKALVAAVDDETIGHLLMCLAVEAMTRGIDPMPVMKAVSAGSAGKAAYANELWGRVITLVDRTKRGAFRFEGNPIYGRQIIGHDLSTTGVDEDGSVVSPVVFGRKDMRGTLWLAVSAKGEGFDMAGTLIQGMKLIAHSDNYDDFEKLCDHAEAVLAGVSSAKVEDRRTVEQKLAALDDWE